MIKVYIRIYIYMPGLQRNDPQNFKNIKCGVDHCSGYVI